MKGAELEKYLEQFDPYRGDGDWVTEDPMDYAARMQRDLLPLWPSEVLVEWFHRHARHLYDYAFLRFETFRFSRETWPIEEIPGKEAFADPEFFDGFQDIEERAKEPYDWLAGYMLENGTWNTPIVILQTPSRDLTGDGGWPIRYPIHLLEGHRRLSFLGGLKRLGKGLDAHDLWIVKIENE